MKAIITALLVLGMAAPGLAQLVPEADYRLGPGDLVDISVLGVPEYAYTVRVGTDGTISLPYVGKIHVNGKTAGELAQQLREAMDGRLFQNPMVSVVVKEFRSNPIILMGAVAKPGKYEIMGGRMTLIDLLLEAGGVRDDAEEWVYVQRQDENGEMLGDPIRISHSRLFSEGTNSALNIPLQWGDLVNIPKREADDIVYIIGDVGGPGVYTLPSDRKVRLTQAIAAAGGTLRTAKLDRGMLVRYDEAGVRKEIAFNFKKMLVGKAPDLFIEPRDIIFIPGSTAKTIGYALVNMVPGTAVSIATRGVIY